MPFFIRAILIGSSKERIMMRKGLSVAKTKVKLRIAQINEAIKECHERQKLGVSRENDRNIETLAKITGNDFHDGVFPWQTDGSNHYLFFVMNCNKLVLIILLTQHSRIPRKF